MSDDSSVMPLLLRHSPSVMAEPTITTSQHPVDLSTHRRYVRTSIAVLTFVPDGWVQGQAPGWVVCGSIFQGAETPKMTPKTTPSGTPQNPPGPPKNKTYLESGPMKPAKIYIV